MTFVQSTLLFYFILFVLWYYFKCKYVLCTVCMYNRDRWIRIQFHSWLQSYQSCIKNNSVRISFFLLLTWLATSKLFVMSTLLINNYICTALIQSAATVIFKTYRLTFISYHTIHSVHVYVWHRYTNDPLWSSVNNHDPLVSIDPPFYTADHPV